MIAYFDCFSGICGDMILGALVDLGLRVDELLQEISKLGLSGYKVTARRIRVNGITATDIVIEVEEKQPHRTYLDIVGLIDESSLDEKIKETSKQVFHRLALAESKIHGVDINEVHFHEVGAIDSIIDIVGSIIGLEKLGTKEVISSPLPLGKGFIKCSHGIIPIPAPATVEILKGIPVYQTGREQELVTPTGAAIITTVARQFIELPMMRIHRVGYGAGKTKSMYPNLLRVFLGEKISL
ncbi:MAG TPA: nickel pincer cofactor biosynthesis protein LarC [Thermoplasmatales archaeon]|nr:nickel pincer cofactor biosynthesis protein LarC [Thermoplasmatales archaeon]